MSIAPSVCNDKSNDVGLLCRQIEFVGAAKSISMGVGPRIYIWHYTSVDIGSEHNRHILVYDSVCGQCKCERLRSSAEIVDHNIARTFQHDGSNLTECFEVDKYPFACGSRQCTRTYVCRSFIGIEVYGGIRFEIETCERQSFGTVVYRYRNTVSYEFGGFVVVAALSVGDGFHLEARELCRTVDEIACGNRYVFESRYFGRSIWSRERTYYYYPAKTAVSGFNYKVCFVFR